MENNNTSKNYTKMMKNDVMKPLTSFFIEYLRIYSKLNRKFKIDNIEQIDEDTILISCKGNYEFRFSEKDGSISSEIYDYEKYDGYPYLKYDDFNIYVFMIDDFIDFQIKSDKSESNYEIKFDMVLSTISDICRESDKITSKIGNNVKIEGEDIFRTMFKRAKTIPSNEEYLEHLIEKEGRKND